MLLTKVEVVVGVKSFEYGKGLGTDQSVESSIKTATNPTQKFSVPSTKSIFDSSFESLVD